MNALCVVATALLHVAVPREAHDSHAHSAAAVDAMLLGNTALALHHARAAVQLMPFVPETQKNLAWLLTTMNVNETDPEWIAAKNRTYDTVILRHLFLLNGSTVDPRAPLLAGVGVAGDESDRSVTVFLPSFGDGAKVVVRADAVPWSPAPRVDMPLRLPRATPAGTTGEPGVRASGGGQQWPGARLHVQLFLPPALARLPAAKYFSPGAWIKTYSKLENGEGRGGGGGEGGGEGAIDATRPYWDAYPSTAAPLAVSAVAHASLFDSTPLGAVMCHFPQMASTADDSAAARSALRALPPLAMRYIDMVKRGVVGYLSSPAASHDGQRGFEGSWDIHYDTQSAAEWGYDKLRLSNVHVGGLNQLQLMLGIIEAEGIVGDVIEAGTYRGGTAIFMAAVLAALRDTRARGHRGAAAGIGRTVPDRVVWVADSFMGIPPPRAETRDRTYPQDPTHAWQPFGYRMPLRDVKDAFARYGLHDDRYVRFVVGFFAEALPKVLSPNKGGQGAPGGGIGSLSLIRLDGDTYDSTMDALTLLYPRLSVGGFVVIDDFHLSGCRQAVVDYRRRHGLVDPILPTPIDYTRGCAAADGSGAHNGRRTRRVALCDDLLLLRRPTTMLVDQYTQGAFWRRGSAATAAPNTHQPTRQEL